MRIEPVHTRFAAAHARAIRESYAEISHWQPWPLADQSEQHSADWLGARMQDFQDGKAYEFLVLDDSNAVLAGGGISQIHDHHQSANIGYWTHSAHAGQGIATTLIQHNVAWARSHTQLNRLEIVAEVDNVGSWRAAEKAGAHFEGIAKARLRMRAQCNDARVYSFTR